MKSQIMSAKGIVAVLAITLPIFAGTTWAGPVTVNGSGLQDALDTQTSGGSSSIDVNGDQTVSPNWVIISDPTSQTTLLAEFAGFAGTNQLGIYDVSNPANRLLVYSGSASAGDTATIVYDPITNLYSINGGTGVMFGSGAIFGFYLDNGHGQVFFSDPSLNETSTVFPSGVPHMLAFQGNGQDCIIIPNSGGQCEILQPSDYIMAWEDLPADISDFDYDDMIVRVNDVAPVPEPGILSIFGLGLLAIGLAGRCKSR